MAMPEIDEVKDAALKYDKKALAKMVQMGQMSSTTAMMAAMMRDRIVQSEMKPPAPPTVADEVFQPAMQQGLAAVPTDPRMFQGMAGGGIVAMAGGGDVQRFQNRGLVQTSPATTFMGNLDEYGIGEQPAVGMGSFYGRLNRDVQRGGIFSSSAIERDLLLRELGYTTQQINAMPREVQEKVIAENTRANAPMTREQVASDTGGVPAVPAPAAPAPAPAPAPARRLPAAAPTAGISAIDEYRKAEEARIKSMEKQLGTEPTVQGIIESGRAFDKEYGVDRDFFKNQAADLIAQKEELKGDRKEAANMRLLEAGLAILGGTSPYAFENIGKGASKALAGFADDIKDIKKQTRELEKARQDVLRAEQVAARSDSARDQDRFEKEKEKFRAKEAAIENARVDATKTLIDLGFKERQIRATEKQAAATEKNADRVSEGMQMLSIATEGMTPEQKREFARELLKGKRGNSNITPAQMANLKMKASGEVDPDVVRRGLAKGQGLSKVPKPGEDASFDKQVNTAIQNQIEERLRFYLGQGESSADATAQTFPGYKVVSSRPAQ